MTDPNTHNNDDDATRDGTSVIKDDNHNVSISVIIPISDGERQSQRDSSLPPAPLVKNDNAAWDHHVKSIVALLATCGEKTPGAWADATRDHM